MEGITMNSQTLTYELALQKAAQRQMDSLVRAANADAALLEGSGMDKNQIRNVLNVAEESRSLAVVTNFIRYQLGRSQTGPAWRKNGFGLRVIKQIEDPKGIIAQQTEAVLKKVQERVEDIPQDVAKELRYDLMRYYLGYLNRAFIYGKETGKWNDLREAKEER
jgi:protein-tyrosine-phosphatase